jgi:transcription initiation factor TFIID subunit 8
MLRRFNLPIASLKPHLRHPVPVESLEIDFFDPVGPEEDPFTSLPLLSVELSGQAEKDSKPYIPEMFPEFPSIHTYKYTPKEDDDGRNPKRMREEAAKAAKQGEEALRRLVRAAKIRQQKEVRSLAEKDALRKERHSLWETAMQSLVQQGGSEQQVLGQVEIADHSMIVNAEVSHERREVPQLGKRIPGTAEPALGAG